MRDEDCGPGGVAGGFGVRRPLRFLSFKLGLRPEQVETLARILDVLKTERAQAAVDDRRVLAAVADLTGAAQFDAEKAEAAVAPRVESARRLKEAVVGALGEIHALLDERQRAQLAYLIRTGVILL